VFIEENMINIHSHLQSGSQVDVVRLPKASNVGRHMVHMACVAVHLAAGKAPPKAGFKEVVWNPAIRELLLQYNHDIHVALDVLQLPPSCQGESGLSIEKLDDLDEWLRSQRKAVRTSCSQLLELFGDLSDNLEKSGHDNSPLEAVRSRLRTMIKRVQESSY
jgi:hypothetical protein